MLVLAYEIYNPPVHFILWRFMITVTDLIHKNHSSNLRLLHSSTIVTKFWKADQHIMH